MNYSQSLDFLESFANLEKLSQLPENSFFNLKRMEHLLAAAGHPEKKFLPVLITGTTGKGSTGFFLESILRANHIPVGFYHSPHVEDVRERIRIDGKMASGKLWAKGLPDIRRLLTKRPLPSRLGVLTYFEIMTFLAILLFAKTKRQIGIFEIGLGGRLDATNVLKAPLVILTPIHLDHEAFLGNTIAKIAREKAGIIKKGCNVVTVPQAPEARAEILKTVRAQKARLFESAPYQKGRTGLAGDFQKMNAGAAVQAARILRLMFGFRIDPATYSQALSSGNWPGRMECFRKFGRKFILDGAHNPISIKRSADSLKGSWVIFGAMQDKNSKAMLKILAKRFRKVIVTRVRSARAKPVAALIQEAKNLFKCVLPAQNIGEAVRLSRSVTGRGETIVVTGSFYLVGEARKFLRTGHGPRASGHE